MFNNHHRTAPVVANGYTFVLVHSGYYTKIPMARVADKKNGHLFLSVLEAGSVRAEC